MANGDSEHPGTSNVSRAAYKITISIIFGLLGFAVNFYPVDFVFYGTYRMSFLFGLIFPMLITLAWGWRYGLLSALCGGCQTMWILWLPGSGYGPLVSVPPFTLWIVWHGWFSRTKYNIYLGELIFRIFNTVLLFTVFRWVFTLNVPPANTFMPLAVTLSIVFKEAVNGLLIIFIAQGLLYSDTVRTFFKLPKSTADPRLYYIYTNAVILGVILIFSFVGEEYIWGLWGPEFQSVARILGSVTLLLVGIFCTYGAANVFARRKSEEVIKAQDVLRESENNLSQIVESSSVPTFVIDKGHIVTHWNRACENITGVSASEVIGTKKQWLAFYSAERPVMADLIVDEPSKEEIAKYYGGKYKKSVLIDKAYEAEEFFPLLGESGKWLFVTAAPLRDREGKVTGAIETLQDVTASKQAEDALRESEVKYRLLAENTIDCIWQMNLNLEFTYVNPAILQMFGFTQEEWIGSSLSEHCSPEALEFMSGKAMDELNKDSEASSATFETQMLRENGETIAVEITGMLLFDETKNPVGFQGTTRDISERKQAEEALISSERFLNSIVEQSPVSMWISDSEGTILKQNQACRDLFGVRDKEVIGKYNLFKDNIFQEQGLIPLIRDVFKKGEVARFEVDYNLSRIKHLEVREAKHIIIEVVIAPIIGSQGNVINAVIQHKDVTKQRRAEEELRKSEGQSKHLYSMVRLMCDNLPDLIWTKDLEGKFIFANKSCCEVLLNAKDTDEPIGKTDIYFGNREKESHPENPDYHTFGATCTDSDRAVIETRKALRSEESGNVKGEFLYLDVYKAPFWDEKGDLIGTVGCARIITREKEIEEARRLAEEKLKQLVIDLERSNAELEQFAYVASHDLQEPLRMVSSYVQLLAQRYKGKLDSDADDFIGYAVDGAIRMQTLINDLLAYSRVGTRGKPPEPTDCETVHEQVLTNLKMAIEKSGAVITHDALPTVMADESQLVQLFQNLIENAIKFRGDEVPRIHISATRGSAFVDSDSRQENTHHEAWVFAVRDNGIGLEPEFFDRIFTIFQRLHSRDEYAGTGIGLAVCKKIVERHGGRIWVESELGMGTTFFFSIPARGSESAIKNEK